MFLFKTFSPALLLYTVIKYLLNSKIISVTLRDGYRWDFMDAAHRFLLIIEQEKDKTENRVIIIVIVFTAFNITFKRRKKMLYLPNYTHKSFHYF